MKVKKWITVETEVEVDVDRDDIRAAMLEDSEGCTQGDNPERALMVTLNRIAEFMKAVPDDVIAKLNLAQRKVVGEFFAGQANRYKSWTDSPGLAFIPTPIPTPGE